MMRIPAWAGAEIHLGYPAVTGGWLSYWWLSCPWQCGFLNLGMANEEGMLAGLMAAAKVGNVPGVMTVLSTSPCLVSGVEEHYPRRTPLMLACGRGHVEVVRLLLEADAPVETRDALGRTALIHATGSGEATVMGMLLEAGAGVGVVCGYGGSALHYAAGRGHNPILTTILTHVQRRLKKEERQAVLELRQRRGETALHMACGCGREEGVRALLLAGADPNTEDDEGGSCLDAARQGEHAHIQHILQWWEGEAVRVYTLHRAHSLDHTTPPHVPYLQARIQANQPLPILDLVFKNEGRGEEEETGAVIEWVVRQLHTQLHTELLLGMGIR